MLLSILYFVRSSIPKHLTCRSWCVNRTKYLGNMARSKALKLGMSSEDGSRGRKLVLSMPRHAALRFAGNLLSSASIPLVKGQKYVTDVVLRGIAGRVALLDGEFVAGGTLLFQVDGKRGGDRLFVKLTYDMVLALAAELVASAQGKSVVSSATMVVFGLYDALFHVCKQDRRHRAWGVYSRPRKGKAKAPFTLVVGSANYEQAIEMAEGLQWQNEEFLYAVYGQCEADRMEEEVLPK